MISVECARVLFSCQFVFFSRYFTAPFLIPKLFPSTPAGGFRSFSPVDRSDLSVWYDAQKARSPAWLCVRQIMAVGVCQADFLGLRWHEFERKYTDFAARLGCQWL